MPSVGVTLSKLKDGLDPESPELMQKWKLNKELFDSFFGFDYPLRIYKCMEEPNLVFTAGPFAEQEEHLVDFAQSDEMEEYLDEFGETLDLHGVFHIEGEWQEEVFTAPYLSLGRYFVEADKTVEFEKAFRGMVDNLPPETGETGFISGWTLKGGWRDKVEGDDSAKLGDLKRKDAIAKWQAGADGPDDADDTVREWVNLFGWESHEAMIKSLSAMDKPVSERPEWWQPITDLVTWSRQCIFQNYTRVGYEAAS